MMSRVVLFALGATFLFGAAHAQTAGEIQKSLNGRNLSLSCLDGTRATGRYKMNKGFGTISGIYQAPSGETSRQTARVRVQGSSICLRVKMVGNGEEGCYGITQTSVGSYQLSSAGFQVCSLAAR